MTQTRERLKLGGFSRERIKLIRSMEDDGWTGRITANGHALMLAPDNGPTCTVAPKAANCPRARGNSESVYKAWQREQGS